MEAAVEAPSVLCLLLQYLHNEKRLLHGDMKSCNVVIKGDFESIKICDVGVSLQLDENMKGDDSGVQMVSLATRRRFWRYWLRIFYIFKEKRDQRADVLSN